MNRGTTQKGDTTTNYDLTCDPSLTTVRSDARKGQLDQTGKGDITHVGDSLNEGFNQRGSNRGQKG